MEGRNYRTEDSVHQHRAKSKSTTLFNQNTEHMNGFGVFVLFGLLGYFILRI